MQEKNVIERIDSTINELNKIKNEIVSETDGYKLNTFWHERRNFICHDLEELIFKFISAVICSGIHEDTDDEDSWFECGMEGINLEDYELIYKGKKNEK
jgi:hypothetical protein